MTSARRQAAMIGTWSSSAKRSSSVEVRARSTPPPARMTGRWADARNSMTARISSSRRRATAGGRALSARASSGIGSSRRSSGSESRTGPGRPPSAWRTASAIVSRDLVGGVRFGGPLGQPAERRDLVDLLERLAPEQGALDLADRRRTSGSSPGARCGSRWRGSRHRPRGSRARPPVARSAGRGPRP